jgi:hypothetical protein
LDPVFSVRNQSTAMPWSASSIAGASVIANGIVPKRSSASPRPSTSPGTAIESGPCTLRSSFTDGHVKRSRVVTPPPTSG